jgi:hypothetical protein
MSDIDQENSETAIAAMLLAAAAAQVAEPPAPEPEKEEPLDLHALVDQQAGRADQLRRNREAQAELRRQLQALEAEAVELEAASEAIKTKIYEALFGRKPERAAPQPQLISPVPAAAGSAAPARKLDNSIVNDRSSPDHRDAARRTRRSRSRSETRWIRILRRNVNGFRSATRARTARGAS